MNIKGHFETITRHKLLVMKYCFACGLYEQGLAHSDRAFTTEAPTP